MVDERGSTEKREWNTGQSGTNASMLTVGRL
jgi:hypothetical protein